MCGFAGLWCADPQEHTELTARVVRMRDTLAHRGPDGAGTWVNASAGIGLGHRRLAIQDLSAAGHQPMQSASGRYTIAYNGEVYNVAELTAKLEGPFQGTSDTERLLAAFERWGVLDALPHFVGMFAFALWDAELRRLWLVRDRVGIKPLYVGRAGRSLAFGSELKALIEAPGFDKVVDRGALAAYLRYNCVPADRSIWRNVRKVLPGTALEIRSPESEPIAHTWWSAADVAREGHAAPLQDGDEGLVERLDATLREAVSMRLLSDVPLGAFLSGGIDSSTVVALMQAQSTRPVRTFSIGYEEAAYDEAGHAAAVAKHLGTDHTSWIVTAKDALDTIPAMPELFDEPFSDSSQVPTHLVSKLARQHVTVALSGDGGDELFGGYNRHLWAPRVWRALRRIPKPVRRGLGSLVRRVPPAATDRAWSAAGPVLPARFRVRVPGEKLHKLGAVLGSDSEGALYRALCSHTADPLAIVLSDEEAPAVQADVDVTGLSFAEGMMLRDLCTYLPDDILTKVDRASMGVGLEARVPILDHRVIALAWSLPLHAKIRGGVTKWALRQVLYRYVPQAMVDREKSGFGVPIDQWLRGPLRSWAEALLAPTRLQQEGFFRPEPIRQLWVDHLSGRRNTHHQLWDILMFQAWSARWGGR